MTWCAARVTVGMTVKIWGDFLPQSACQRIEVMHALQMLATYPINAARNMAMLLARTELVFPLDIDLLPSKDFSDIVLDPERHSRCAQLLRVMHRSLGL